MSFEKLIENTENIQENVANYLATNLEYYKLRSFKIAMKSTALILKFSLILVCVLMILLFCSFALAFFIGDYFSSYPIGFLIVGGIYFLFTILLFFVKDRIIEGSILEKFSEIFFND